MKPWPIFTIVGVWSQDARCRDARLRAGVALFVITGAAAWMAASACGGSQPASDQGDSGSDSDNPDGIGGGDGSGDGPDGTMTTCGTSGWLTYGHDGARTFASDACIKGPLSVAWTYTPAPPTSRTTNGVQHALADSNGVYLHWSASDGQYTGTTAEDRVSPSGARVWTFDSGTDSNFDNWESVTKPVSVDGSVVQSVMIQEDGVSYLDLATGKKRAGTGVDWWGQTIPDLNGGVWFVDILKLDGPGLGVGELDLDAKVLWQENKQGAMCGQGLGDVMGGIAVDDGALFYAAVLTTGSATQPTFKTGLYAFDSATGTPKWNVASTPASVISAGNGLVYGIEADSVVARSQQDGTVKWSSPLTGAGAQAPVLAAGLVVAAGSSAVSAFNATTGAPAWSTPMTGAATHAFQNAVTNGCAGTSTAGGAVATSLAAAVPSGTLVVTASDGVHILSLSTGADQWHGMIQGAKYAVHDPVLVGSVVYVVDSLPSPYLGFGPGRLIALKGAE